MSNEHSIVLKLDANGVAAGIEKTTKSLKDLEIAEDKVTASSARLSKEQKQQYDLYKIGATAAAQAAKEAEKFANQQKSIADSNANYLLKLQINTGLMTATQATKSANEHIAIVQKRDTELHNLAAKSASTLASIEQKRDLEINNMAAKAANDRIAIEQRRAIEMRNIAAKSASDAAAAPYGRNQSGYAVSEATVRSAYAMQIREETAAIAGMDMAARKAAEAKGVLAKYSHQFMRTLVDLTPIISGLGLLTLAHGAIQATDAYTKLTSQLKTATNSTSEYAFAMSEVKRISSAAQVDIGAIGSLYQRLSLATQASGTSQKEVALITETVSLGLKANGASARESASAMLQLSQSFGSGRMAGEEFNSMAEAAPNVLRALAVSMGVPYGALKQLASEGKITTEVMVKAFTDPALLASFQAQAKSMRTITGSWVELTNALVLYVGETSKASGGVGVISSALSFLADNLKKIADGIIFAASMMTLKFSVSILQAAADFVLLEGAATKAMVKITALSVGSKAGLIGLALFAAYEVADYMGFIDQIFSGAEERIKKLRADILSVREIESQKKVKTGNDNFNVVPGLAEDAAKAYFKSIGGAVKEFRAYINTDSFIFSKDFLSKEQENAAKVKDLYAKLMSDLARLFKDSPTEARNKKEIQLRETYAEKVADLNKKETTAAGKAAEAAAKEVAASQSKIAVMEAEMQFGVKLTDSQKKLIELGYEQTQTALKTTDAKYAENAARLAGVAVVEMEKAAYADAIKENEHYIDGLLKAADGINKETESIASKLAAVELETASIGKTKAEIDLLQAARYDHTTVMMKERLAIIESTGACTAESAALEEAIKVREKYKNAQVVQSDTHAAQAAIDAQNKAAKEALAEQTAAAKKQWEMVDGFAHTAFNNILDKGKNVFKEIGDAIKKYLLDMLYKMTVQKWLISVAASMGMTGVAAAGQAATGAANAMGAAGGAGSWLSAGQSLWNGFSGAAEGAGWTTATGQVVAGYGAGAGIAGGAGLGMAGMAGSTPIMSAAYSAPAIAGGASMGSMVATAMPYIAAAVAIYMIGKSLFGGGETRSGGTYGAQGQLIHGPSGGQIAGDTITKSINDTNTNINLLLGKFGSAATITGFAGYLESSKGGRGGSFAAGTVAGQRIVSNVLGTGETNYGQTGIGQSLTEQQAATQFADNLARVTLMALQAAKDIPLYLQGIFHSIDPMKSSPQLINDTIAFADTLQKVHDPLVAAGVSIDGFALKVPTLKTANETLAQTTERLAGAYLLTDGIAKMMGVDTSKAFGSVGLASLEARDKLVQLMGGLQQASATMQTYYNFTTTDAQKLADSTATVSEAFKKAGFVMPTTAAGFDEMVKAQMALGPAGAVGLAALLNLAPAVAAITPSAEQAAQALKDSTAAFMGFDAKGLSKMMMDAAFNPQAGMTAAESFSVALGDSVRNALLTSAMDSIANTIFESIITPTVTGAVLGAKVSELTTTEVIADAKKKLEKLNELFNNPEFQAFLDGLSGYVATIMANMPKMPKSGGSSGGSSPTTPTNNAADILNQKLALQAEIFKLLGDAAGSAAILEKQHGIALAAMDASLRPLQTELWALQKAAEEAAKAQQLLSSKLSVQMQIAELTGNESEKAAILEQQHKLALEELAKQDPTGQLGELTLHLWNLQAAAAAAAKAQKLLTDKLSIQAQIYELTGNSAAAAAVLEQQHKLALEELNKQDPTGQLGELTAQLWALQDAAKKAEAAAKLLNDRMALQSQIYELTGNKAAAAALLAQQRAIDLAKLDPSLRGLQTTVWKLQDAAKIIGEMNATLAQMDAVKAFSRGITDTINSIKAEQGNFAAGIATAVTREVEARKKLAGAVGVDKQLAAAGELKDAIMARYAAESAEIKRVQGLIDALGNSIKGIDASIHTVRSQMKGYDDVAYTVGKVAEANTKLIGSTKIEDKIAAGADLEKAINDRYNAQMSNLQKQRDAENKAGEEAVAAANKLGQESVDAFNKINQAMKNFADYAKALLIGDKSALTVQSKLLETQAQYNDLLAKTKSGDTDAAGKLQGVADTLLQQRRDTSVSAIEYARSFAKVQADFASMGAGAGADKTFTPQVYAENTAKWEAAQLALQNAAIAELTELKKKMEEWQKELKKSLPSLESLQQKTINELIALNALTAEWQATLTAQLAAQATAFNNLGLTATDIKDLLTGLDTRIAAAISGAIKPAELPKDPPILGILPIGIKPPILGDLPIGIKPPILGDLPSGRKLPGFADGINEVPYDMTANIHAGEEIKPRAYVDKHKAANDETRQINSEMRAELASSREELSAIKKILYKMWQIEDKHDIEGMPSERLAA